MMRVSIVTPSFNQAAFLPTCLKSVAGQSHKDVEHIVVDGGSTDGSQAILENWRLADERLRYSSEPDRGQGHAVNKGLGSVTGEVVAWLNSDDFYCAPTVFASVVKCFEEDPGLDVLYGGMVYVDLAGRAVHVRVPPPFDWTLLCRLAYIGNTNLFVRRRIADQFRIDERFHFVLDHEFALRVTRKTKVRRTTEMLACFRVHPEAKTQTMREGAKNEERKVRDQKLGIGEVRSQRLRNLAARVRFRMALAASDARRLPSWREHPPYEVFMGKQG